MPEEKCTRVNRTCKAGTCRLRAPTLDSGPADPGQENDSAARRSRTVPASRLTLTISDASMLGRTWTSRILVRPAPLARAADDVFQRPQHLRLSSREPASRATRRQRPRWQRGTRSAPTQSRSRSPGSEPGWRGRVGHAHHELVGNSPCVPRHQTEEAPDRGGEQHDDQSRAPARFSPHTRRARRCRARGSRCRRCARGSALGDEPPAASATGRWRRRDRATLPSRPG